MTKAKIATATLFALLVAPGLAAAQSFDYVETPLLQTSNVVQTVKAAPGALLYASCVNNNAAAVYLQVFDTVGSVTLGTTAPGLSFFIPAGAASGQLGPRAGGAPDGSWFASAGIKAAVTTTRNGAVAPALPVDCAIGHR